MSIRVVAAVAALIGLAGCAAAEPPLAAVWTAAPGAVYCYRTLAEPDCAAAPIAGAGRRRIASGPGVVWTWALPPAADSAVEEGEAR